MPLACELRCVAARLRLLLWVLLTSAGLGVPAAAAAAPGGDRPASDRFISVYGQRIHYVEAGSGPVVILVHGLADDTSVWQAVIGPLSRNFRVLALDQIGFGRSDKPLLNYRVGTLVDFLQAFMTGLHLERATLVGNSLGGWVAASHAALHPDRVDRLVLVDAAGFSSLAREMDPRILGALRLATIDDLRRLAPLTFFAHRFYEPPEALERMFAERVAAGDSYTVGRIVDSMERGEDVLDGRLGAIRNPTLIVWGRQDDLIPLALGKRFGSEIRGSRLIVLDDCGHMPQVECPERFEAALETFMAAPATGPRPGPDAAGGQ